MSKTITGKDVLRQLKADLIGKDSHRGVTFTYTWLANQLGHFSLGFIPTLAVYALLRKYIPSSNSASRAAWGIAALWFVFELYNFLGPLLSNRVSRAKWLFVPSKKRYVFQPAWGNIAFDTITDLCFFWIGGFLALLYVDPIPGYKYVVLGLFLALLLPSRYWYITKMYLQAAGYPFQCRLSQWAFIISDADKQLVEDFLQSRGNNRHLLIFGGIGNGKTGLGVGIATEYSIRHRTCFYTTGMKLYSLFPERHLKSLTNDKNLWTWRQASLLVIDDINPGGVIDDLVTPGQFLRLLDATPTNRETLATKNVIWVLGNEDNDKLPEQTWTNMLREIGVAEDDIYSVRLPQKESSLSYQGRI